jgi:hypothetical protein
MLHLLPFQWLLKGLIAVTGLAVLTATSAGAFSSHGLYENSIAVLRWAGTVDTLVAGIIYFGWHMIPCVRRAIFPHIAGEWKGKISFMDATETEQVRYATLYVAQNLLRIRLVLNTEESTSETLVVHPVRDSDFPFFYLFYIYENRRKEGFHGPGRIYRGTSVISIEDDKFLVMKGTYFTDQKGDGTVYFTRCQALSAQRRLNRSLKKLGIQLHRFIKKVQVNCFFRNAQ